jgi:PA14 domain-containing protein
MATGCVDAEDAVAFPPSAGSSAIGLTSGCNDADLVDGLLRGTVYSVPLETRQLPDFEALRPVGTICMAGLDVTERRGYPGFPGLRNRFEWFAIDFQGAFDVGAGGPVHFRLTSDDGSKLYIDGALVIDNDGYHVTRSAEGDVSLAPGPHRIDIPYWQGPGPMSLVLEAARPGEGYDVFHLDREL